MCAGQTPHTAPPLLSWHQPFCGSFVSSLLPAWVPIPWSSGSAGWWLPGKVTHTDQGMPQPGVHPGILEKQGVMGISSLYSSCYQTGGQWTHGTPLLSTGPTPAPLCASPAHVVTAVPLSLLGLLCVPHGAGTCCPSGGGVSVAAEQDRGELSLGTLIRQREKGGGRITTPKTSLVMSNLPGGAEGASWSCSSPSGNNTQSIPSPCSSSPGDFFPLVKVQTNKLREVFSSNPLLQA